jgi:chemotaxis protein CheD
MPANAEELQSMPQVTTVGLGEIALGAQPDTALVAFGLGSCLAIIAYDPQRKVGGMVHAMLPTRRNGDGNPTKYVDSGIIELMNQLISLGARRDQLIWRIAGGAQMLTAPGLIDRFNIGAQNVTTAHDIVARYNLRLINHDTGGYQGRTVRLTLPDGSVTVRNVNGQERPL